MADAFACSVLISTAPTPRLWTWPIEETLKSLVRHAPMLLRETMTVAFDGADVTLKQPRVGRAAAWDQPMTSSGPPTAFWGEKCSTPANATAYEEHKVLIKELVRGIVPKVQFVEASARLCLAGSLRHAMHVAVRTPFVLVMQSDMPLTRQLEATLPPLLSMMAARKMRQFGSHSAKTTAMQTWRRRCASRIGPTLARHRRLLRWRTGQSKQRRTF